MPQGQLIIEVFLLNYFVAAALGATFAGCAGAGVVVFLAGAVVVAFFAGAGVVVFLAGVAAFFAGVVWAVFAGAGWATAASAVLATSAADEANPNTAIVEIRTFFIDFFIL